MVHVCLVQDGALGVAWCGAVAGHQSHAVPRGTQTTFNHKSVNSVYEKYKNKTFWCGISCCGGFDLDDDATLATKNESFGGNRRVGTRMRGRRPRYFLMFVALAIMRHLISIFLLNMNIAVR